MNTTAEQRITLRDGPGIARHLYCEPGVTGEEIAAWLGEHNAARVQRGEPREDYDPAMFSRPNEPGYRVGLFVRTDAQTPTEPPPVSSTATETVRAWQQALMDEKERVGWLEARMDEVEESLRGLVAETNLLRRRLNLTERATPSQHSESG